MLFIIDVLPVAFIFIDKRVSIKRKHSDCLHLMFFFVFLLFLLNMRFHFHSKVTQFITCIHVALIKLFTILNIFLTYENESLTADAKGKRQAFAYKQKNK